MIEWYSYINRIPNLRIFRINQQTTALFPINISTKNTLIFISFIIYSYLIRYLTLTCFIILILVILFTFKTIVFITLLTTITVNLKTSKTFVHIYESVDLACACIFLGSIILFAFSAAVLSALKAHLVVVWWARYTGLINNYVWRRGT